MATKNHIKEKVYTLEEYIFFYKKWSVRKFAAEAGVSYTSVRNLFKGRDVSSSILISISKATEGHCSPVRIFEDYIEVGKKIKKD